MGRRQSFKGKNYIIKLVVIREITADVLQKFSLFLHHIIKCPFNQ